MKVVFLSSGEGSNFKDYCLRNKNFQDKASSIHVVGLIAPTDCGATDNAKKLNVPFLVIDFSDELELLKAIQFFEPDLVVTTINRIIQPSVLSNAKCKFINLHYSLLPAFAGTTGMTATNSALELGYQFIGVTIHRVTEILDGGHHLCQIAISNNQDLPPENHQNAVYEAGLIALETVFMAFSNPNLKRTQLTEINGLYAIMSVANFKQIFD